MPVTFVGFELEKENCFYSHIDGEKYKEHIETIHPELILPSPLTSEDIWTDRTNMNPSECCFAEVLLLRNIIVFREPKIKKIPSVFDFFVYNPFSNNGGTLVEITTSRRKRLSPQKKKQIARLQLVEERYGISGVVLYRENLQNIERRCSDGCAGLLEV